MPVVNCAATFLKRVKTAVVDKQVRAISSRIAGRAVTRNGIAVNIEAVDHEKQRVSVIDAQAKRSTVSFNEFFSVPVAIVEPSVFLEPVLAADLDAKWIGRSIFRDGQRWKLLKISKQPPSDELLLTLQQHGSDAIAIRSARELEKENWQIRRRAKPSVSTRLAGVYAEQREVPSPAEKLKRAREIYREWRRRGN